MANLTVRDLSSETLEALNKQADALGKSREQYLRDLLNELTQEESKYLKVLITNKQVTRQLQSRVRCFSESPELQAYNVGQRVESDLTRYYLTIDETLKSLHFSRGEALMMCDICNGTLFFLNGISPSSIPMMLYAEIYDGIQIDQTDQKWDVDGKAFLKRVKAFTPMQAIAVIDAIERFWTDDTYQVETDQKIIDVGLVRKSIEP